MLEQGLNKDKHKNDSKLISYFRPFLGNNADDIFETKFVQDYFSTIFEKVGVVRIMYRFSTPNNQGNDRVQFWEDTCNFTTELGNLVYTHGGLLSYSDFNALHAHWGYPINHEDAVPRKMLDFAMNAIQVDRPRSILNYVVMLYFGQAFVGGIGTKQNQTYLAVPDLFLNLPSVDKIPNGICSDKKSRELLIHEIGSEAEVIYPIDY
ncbi:MAG: hypothetical protein K8S87_06085 [Planctomycetes bacterium]|nr:hypothetical protein [Planctomycetota bacterium]